MKLVAVLLAIVACLMTFGVVIGRSPPAPDCLCVPSQSCGFDGPSLRKCDSAVNNMCCPRERVLYN
ncbi:hypothetical protein CBL_12445 [Carabus blaptoides fortunei]